MKRKLFLGIFLSFIVFSAVFGQEHHRIPVFDKVLFYDGYNTLEALADVIEPVPEHITRLSTSLITTKLGNDQLNQIGEYLIMNVVLKAACDNYDRIGNVNLALVPKGQEAYIPEETVRLELGRFITPFMNKNRSPDTVPYRFEVNHLISILKDRRLNAEYDFWLELNIFGVPYSANSQVAGCSGRNDVFYGTVFFETGNTPVPLQDDNVLIPLLMKAPFNNYQPDATDVPGLTIRNIEFSVGEDLTNAKFYLIVSSHGAQTNGEEYNRRIHYVRFDGIPFLHFKPGRTTCEPFRVYNTMPNQIYGYSPRPASSWQSFSNWCPGDVIDNRIIDVGPVNAGNHTFTIEVEEAVFNGDNGPGTNGNIPLSLFLLGTTGEYIHTDDYTVSPEYIMVYPNPASSFLTISASHTIESVKLFNPAGQVVYTGNNSITRIDHLSPGIYFVNILLENGYNSTHKIIKR